MIDASKLPRVPTQLVPASDVKVNDQREQAQGQSITPDPVDMVLQGGRYYVVKQPK